MTDIATRLMPRLSPPTNNADLSSKTQLGIDLEEMVRRHDGSPARSVVEESFRARFTRLIEYSQWQLLFTGSLTVAEPEKPAREIGPGSVAEAASKNDIRKALYENEGESFVICNTRTMRGSMVFFNELRTEAKARIETCDSGYLSGDTLTAENHVKFFQDGVVLVVLGTGKVGRIFKTKPVFEIKEIGEGKFLRGRQRFLPDLTAPERLLVCHKL